MGAHASHVTAVRKETTFPRLSILFDSIEVDTRGSERVFSGREERESVCICVCEHWNMGHSGPTYPQSQHPFQLFFGVFLWGFFVEQVGVIHVSYIQISASDVCLPGSLTVWLAPELTWGEMWAGRGRRVGRDLGPVPRRPTTVKWRQFSQSSHHSTIGTRQTEYHEALPLSANIQSHLTSSFADDGNASWCSICRVLVVEWRLDCENCCHLMVVGLYDTGPR